MFALCLALAVLLAIDWRQSLVIAVPGGWVETWNPLLRWLGDRYGARGVHFWFALVAVAFAAACASWPQWAPLVVGAVCAVLSGLIASCGAWPQWAPWIAGIACAIELAATVNNFYHGIRP